ncbi:MAG: hypothetical protein ABJM86_03080 [Hyphomicrobiales bacterium]
MNKITLGGAGLTTTLLSMFWMVTLHAQEIPKNYNAETMLNLCQGTEGGAKEFQSMVCTFRIQGVSSMMIHNCASINQGFSPFPVLSSERPPSRGAAKQAFINFMQANPSKWALPWETALAHALSETFPCEN